MTHWNLHTRPNESMDAQYHPDDDVIEVFCGNKSAPLQFVKLFSHEVMHRTLDMIFEYEDGTTESQDHFIIELLEASGDL